MLSLSLVGLAFLNPKPSNPQLQTLNPKPYLLDSKLETLNPKPETLTLKPSSSQLMLHKDWHHSSLAEALLDTMMV